MFYRKISLSTFRSIAPNWYSSPQR